MPTVIIKSILHTVDSNFPVSFFLSVSVSSIFFSFLFFLLFKIDELRKLIFFSSFSGSGGEEGFFHSFPFHDCLSSSRDTRVTFINDVNLSLSLSLIVRVTKKWKIFFSVLSCAQLRHPYTLLANQYFSIVGKQHGFQRNSCGHGGNASGNRKTVNSGFPRYL